MKTIITATALLLASTAALAQPNMTDMLMKLDADGNGSVSLEEFLKPYEMQFKHLDQNGDGGISQAEAEQFVKQMQQHMQQMRQQAPKQ
ncbi:EF-hand domain-containing protein [Magnetovirga frankeli]|uniref:EF-hand domain-containing protein n=1 Tax=Magnetovirga frankeli TaxID=947516 RepID=UPI001AF7834F|nr:EF-hand domain-containing protein [gamma proteobacterium SS-5]